MNKMVFWCLNQIEQYESEVYSHSCRVANISYFIGRHLGLSIDELNTLKNAAYLHDLGKLKISRGVLNKREPLTSEEWLQIKRHPTIGHRLLKRTKKPVCQISNAVLSHHEFFDGNGYPDGVKGEDIPFLSRIIAVADGIDAMVTYRPYRKPLSLADACREIKDCSGHQFDPYVSSVLLKHSIDYITAGIYRRI